MDYTGSLLIDEQDKLVLSPTYYDQAYFDNLSHYVTHGKSQMDIYVRKCSPLLGIILLSIRCGMNPITWCNSGVLMLPGIVWRS